MGIRKETRYCRQLCHSCQRLLGTICWTTGFDTFPIGYPIYISDILRFFRLLRHRHRLCTIVWLQSDAKLQLPLFLSQHPWVLASLAYLSYNMVSRLLIFSLGWEPMLQMENHSERNYRLEHQRSMAWYKLASGFCWTIPCHLTYHLQPTWYQHEIQEYSRIRALSAQCQGSDTNSIDFLSCRYRLDHFPCWDNDASRWVFISNGNQ